MFILKRKEKLYKFYSRDINRFAFDAANEPDAPPLS